MSFIAFGIEKKHIVFIPPQLSRRGTSRRSHERRKGSANFVRMNTSGCVICWNLTREDTKTRVHEETDVTDHQKLIIECALDALYLIGNELQHAESECTGEAGNAIYLLHGILTDCLKDKVEESVLVHLSENCGTGWLEEIREAQGVSQKTVAEAVGISQPAYCNIEKGKRGVSVETAKRIAEVLGFAWTRFYESA